MSLVLDVVAATDAGRVRQENEDCIVADAAAGLAVLADGMGGHNAGEVASRMAAELVVSGIRAACGRDGRLDPALAERLIASHVAAANAGIFDAARSERRYDGMGTTLVVVAWHAAGVTWGHVGDSRLYLLRDGSLRQLTRDHSIVQEQLERGAISREEARHSANRNVLTRAVGIDPYVEADVSSSDARPGDVYLLCSDGLTDMLPDEEIAGTLRECGPQIRVAAKRLIDEANARGGLDNISVIVARVIGPHGSRA
jgi:protein phosphatase